ncbi:MAG: polyprenyl synthetase family protein [Candidatus Methanomethylophilaceae archaeon]|nr:polyprenyl synthetase family protein [Candidatus Methanomethylophilaceae archaeon]
MPKAWFDNILDDMRRVDEFAEEATYSDNPELNEMCRYVMGSGGKKFRPAVCILSYLACGGEDRETAAKVGTAFEIIHNASLIHDDINDNGEVRRGRRTLHREYSISKAVVVGDFLLAKGFSILAESSVDIVKVIVNAAVAMGESEFVQQRFEHKDKVTEDDYLEIIGGKTSKLIEACARAGAMLADSSEKSADKLGLFAAEIGVAFQIVDDVLDVTGDPHMTGKKVGLDLEEGKPTLPIIYAMEHETYGRDLASLFRKKGLSEEEKDRAIELIKSTDSLDRCLARAQSAADKALKYLSGIPESEYKESLKLLAQYTVSRDR